MMCARGGLGVAVVKPFPIAYVTGAKIAFRPFSPPDRVRELVHLPGGGRQPCLVARRFVDFVPHRADHAGSGVVGVLHASRADRRASAADLVAFDTTSHKSEPRHHRPHYESLLRAAQGFNARARARTRLGRRPTCGRRSAPPTCPATCCRGHSERRARRRAGMDTDPFTLNSSAKASLRGGGLATMKGFLAARASPPRPPWPGGPTWSRPIHLAFSPERGGWVASARAPFVALSAGAPKC